ncbi:MAG: hypothetical protein KBD50_03715 [Candidatus Pacebacteria bacterium]|nr:hypothetical protein [Candidatus Paceibacterota bacterium]
MKVNAKSYPHPVLGNGDDLGGFFKVEFPYELGRETVVLNPTFALKNAGIEGLIKKGKASFMAEVECRSTFFRKSFSTRNAREKFPIPSKSLRERVTVGFYICADQDIKGYRPTEAHSDYEDAPPFDIEVGAVLAVGGYASFVAEKSFDPLRPPMSSFMAIDVGSLHEGPMEIEYEAAKITIILSKTDHKSYLEVRNQPLAHGIIHASIVFPALVDAIYKLRDTESNYESMNWYGRLDAILEANKLQDKDAFEAAQKILENPATRGFAGIESLTSTSDDETYE